MALKIIDYGSRNILQMVKLRDVILRKPLGWALQRMILKRRKIIFL
jgi:hypothetical protein